MEPTCGTGNFILAALDTFPTLKCIYGVELHAPYLWAFKPQLLHNVLKDGKTWSAKLKLEVGNVFTYDFAALKSTGSCW